MVSFASPRAWARTNAPDLFLCGEQIASDEDDVRSFQAKRLSEDALR